MITDIEVEDYQSLRQVSIKPGRLTVITGPTGSGKSGLIRAIRLVVFNARGTSYIRHGAKVAKAMLGFRQEDTAVAIHRGPRGADKYVVAVAQPVPDGPAKFPMTREYTKLGGQVPPEVSTLLCLGEINFAGQFDRPFLLTDSGSQVARTLGELTNVTLVFDAAREANRRKAETARELKGWETTLAGLKEQAQQFRGLKERMRAAMSAQSRLAVMEQITERRDGLKRLHSEWSGHEAARMFAEGMAARLAPPPVARLDELQQQRDRLIELESARHDAVQDLATADTAVDNWQVAHIEAEQELHELLVAAGVCPTCGQEVSGLWRDYRESGSSSSRSAARSSCSRMAASARLCASRRLTAMQRRRRRGSSMRTPP